MKEFDGLIDLIKNLSTKLKESKKSPGTYYESLYKRLMSAQSKEDAFKILEEIIPSAKIKDLGNFSYEEEKLWDEMWGEANRIYETSSISNGATKARKER